ncbi:hypothetical protein [Brevundimonas sp.]|uniref:hypothetical protein n=1 Tax=Brevundimonas sp. TaxID=1871086 RepID=UPI0025CDD6BD|nr:hypothetical protein [Brevundimonas sp.]
MAAARARIRGVFRAIFFSFIVVIACVAATVVVRTGPFDLSSDNQWLVTALIWLAGVAVLAGGLIRRRLRAASKGRSSPGPAGD